MSGATLRAAVALDQLRLGDTREEMLAVLTRLADEQYERGRVMGRLEVLESVTGVSA